MSLAPAVVSSQICVCAAPLSSKPLFIMSRWCMSLRCYRNNPIKWTAGEVDRLSERLLNRCLSGHREAMVMTAGLDSCSRGTSTVPQAHAHTITHQFETLYDANVQISNGGPYGNLSHLSQTNSLRTGVKHSRQCWLWSLKLCYCSRRYCSKLMYLVKSCWKKWRADVCANVQFSLRLLINYLLTLHNSSLTIGPRHEWCRADMDDKTG